MSAFALRFFQKYPTLLLPPFSCLSPSSAKIFHSKCRSILPRLFYSLSSSYTPSFLSLPTSLHIPVTYSFSYTPSLPPTPSLPSSLQRESMWLSLEDTYTVMDEHANSVEENVKEFKTLLEPIYRYVLYRTLPSTLPLILNVLISSINHHLSNLSINNINLFLI